MNRTVIQCDKCLSYLGSPSERTEVRCGIRACSSCLKDCMCTQAGLVAPQGAVMFQASGRENYVLRSCWCGMMFIPKTKNLPPTTQKGARGAHHD
jgi:hypothetical protein